VQNQSFATGILFTLISATGIALVGLFGKLGGKAFSLESLIFWRYLASFLLCILTLWICGKLHNVFSFGNPKLHFLRAAFVLGTQYSFYYYIQRDTLLNGLVLLSLGPLSIPVIEWVITRHRIGKSTWVGLAVSFVGMLCVLQPSGGIFSRLSLIGILAGIFQGCSQVVFGISGKSERTELSTLYMFFLCLVISLFPCLFFESSFEPELQDHSYAIGLILALGAVSVMSQLTRAVAYKHGTPSRLATFLYFSIVFGGFLDWLVFNKLPNLLSIIGAILVITGGVLKIYLRSIILRNKRP
jgi:drug/metabolite transporter (DMT)-like permease